MPIMMCCNCEEFYTCETQKEAISVFRFMKEHEKICKGGEE